MTLVLSINSVNFFREQCNVFNTLKRGFSFVLKPERLWPNLWLWFASIHKCDDD